MGNTIYTKSFVKEGRPIHVKVLEGNTQMITVDDSKIAIPSTVIIGLVSDRVASFKQHIGDLPDWMLQGYLIEAETACLNYIRPAKIDKTFKEMGYIKQ